ncbi:MAG TPA: hypothetical protein PLC99_13345 [Verrucomicrobiota bacterium]|nr:hypothetical protein [Verrucomicrobiota bacterium]
MKTTGSPFCWVDGEPHVIENFTLDDSEGVPPLKQILEDLLERFPGSDLLILRKLQPAEAKLLQNDILEREHETWAHIAFQAKKGDTR